MVPIAPYTLPSVFNLPLHKSATSPHLILEVINNSRHTHERWKLRNLYYLNCFLRRATSQHFMLCERYKKSTLEALIGFQGNKRKALWEIRGLQIVHVIAIKDFMISGAVRGDEDVPTDHKSAYKSLEATSHRYELEWQDPSQIPPPLNIEWSMDALCMNQLEFDRASKSPAHGRSGLTWLVFPNLVHQIFVDLLQQGLTETGIWGNSPATYSLSAPL